MTTYKLLFAPLLLFPSLVLGQSITSLDRDPNVVLLMKVANLSNPAARAEIIRRAGEFPQNIILVTNQTKAPDLAYAIGVVLASRRAHGETLSRELRSFVLPRQSRPASRNEASALSDIDRLSSARSVTVPGVGEGPAVVVVAHLKAVKQD